MTIMAIPDKDLDILLKAVAKNTRPAIKVSDIEIEPDTLFDTGIAQIAVFPSVVGKLYFTQRLVQYERFSLQAYKEKEADVYLLVPAIRALTPPLLVNYMNELYINSITVHEAFNNNDFFRNYQVLLDLRHLKSFSLDTPQVGDDIEIQAIEDSYIFYGVLRIKFI